MPWEFGCGEIISAGLFRNILNCKMCICGNFLISGGRTKKFERGYVVPDVVLCTTPHFGHKMNGLKLPSQSTRPHPGYQRSGKIGPSDWLKWHNGTRQEKQQGFCHLKDDLEQRHTALHLVSNIFCIH